MENKGTIVVTNVMGAFKMTRFDKLRTHITANSEANMSQQDDAGGGNRDPPLPFPLLMSSFLAFSTLQSCGVRDEGHEPRQRGEREGVWGHKEEKGTVRTDT